MNLKLDIKKNLRRLLPHLRIIPVFVLGIIVGVVMTTVAFYLNKPRSNYVYKIPFKFANLFDLAQKDLDLKFSDSEMTTLVTTKNYDLSLIKVYQDVNLHKHPEDHVLIILSGEGLGGGEGGETFKIGPGSYAQVPRGGAHSLINTGKEPLVILQLSSPPFDPTKIRP